ncbi:uncharacterized protein [Spinacia oleracea]|uniref:RNase H type-1 domain-containing protein n=1 Tax=Spinacia oleracea TaxID=3562 RepID=A0ABM3RJD7_SPIOL|nr:uncharacterized protein LOC130470141 [Spinacia oleracea]
MQFPRLFLLAVDRLASVASHGFWDGLNWAWNFAWSRPLRSRDILDKENLLSLFNQVCLAPGSKDCLIWTYHKSGMFSTKSFTLELSKANLPPQIDAIKGIWKGLVPHRIEVFVWTSLLGRINTKSKLVSLGIIPPSEDICVLCNSSSENHNHLLLHCPFSTQERNYRIFDKISSSLPNIHDLILLRLGWWLSGWNEPFPYSPTDIQRNPNCLLWGGKATRPPKSPSLLSSIWSAPAHGYLKWNVDASFNPHISNSAIDGVLRNHAGHFMCLFSCPIPPMEINCAEVLAIHRALTITWANSSLRDTSIVIKSDSANAVSWCNSVEGGPWNLVFQLNFIRSSCKSGLDVTIVHKGRSSNQVADSLAKQGLLRRDNFVAWL